MPERYYHDDTLTLDTGDATEVLAGMPEDSIDCVVTSPPQWGLRDYGTATFTGGDPGCRHTLGTTPHQRRTTKKHGFLANTERFGKRCRTCGARCHDPQYGLEATLADYVHRMRDVASGISRVLTSTGTLWLNLRDSYSYHDTGTGSTRNREAHGSDSPYSGVVRHKSLLGIPWRVVLALQDEGWIVRNAIVWHKPNGIPDPASERLSARHEMLFLLVQQPDYYINIDAIREPYSQDRPYRRRTHRGGTKPYTVSSPWSPPDVSGKNPGDVWSLSTRPLSEAHPGAFPVDVPLRCIAAGCPESGVVLDPFSGAGTTGLAARELGRRYRGIDVRADYHDMFLRRLAAGAGVTVRHQEQSAPRAGGQ